MLLIPCGGKKVKTRSPVMAKDLYTGGIFQAVLLSAVKLDKDVRILSAGYGLLKLNDMVESYDVKMTPVLALLFKKYNVVTGSGNHLLPSLYALAAGEKYIGLAPIGIGIGQIRAVARSLASKEKNLINLDNLKPGNIAERLCLEGKENKNIPGSTFGICSFVGSLFEKESLTIKEACEKVTEKYGESLGVSHKSTVIKQLRDQAAQRGVKVLKYKNSSGEIKYTYEEIK